MKLASERACWRKGGRFSLTQASSRESGGATDQVSTNDARQKQLGVESARLTEAGRICTLCRIKGRPMKNAFSMRVSRLRVLAAISATCLANGIAHSEQSTHSDSTITHFSIPNSGQYCKQLHLVVDSAKDGFKSISVGMFSPPKILLPDMYCSMVSNPAYYNRQISRGEVPDPKSRSYLEYLCNVFADESDSDANIKLNAYAEFTSECLGQGWVRSDVNERRAVVGKEVSIRSRAGEPIIEIRTSVKENGTSMFITVSLPP
jgi:hypothetical protein